MATQTGSYDFKAAKDAYDKGKAAEDEAKATHAYFWHNTTETNNEGLGAHITQIEQDEFISDPESGGGNTLITPNTVEIRDGTKDLASFNSGNVQIGQDDSTRMIIQTDGISGSGQSGEYFGIKYDENNPVTTEINIPYKLYYVYNGGTISRRFNSNYPIHTWKDVKLENISQGSTITVSKMIWPLYVSRPLVGITFEGNLTSFKSVSTSNCSSTPSSTATTADYVGVHNSSTNFTFTEGTSDTKTYSASFTSNQISFTITITMSYFASTERLQFSYRAEASSGETKYITVLCSTPDIKYIGSFSPSNIKVGTVNGTLGGFSSALGLGLTASYNFQTVIGKFNDSDSNALFIVGNGTSDSSRTNAFSVSNSGIIKCRDNNNNYGSIFNLIYPVGAIYMSVNSTSPQTLFGGTWERITGRFLLAATDNGSSEASQAPGNTGGAATVTLTAAQSGLPSHSHSPSSSGNQFVIIKSSTSIGNNRPGSSGTTTNYFPNTAQSTNPWGRNTSTTSESKNATSAHENMPPYLAVYVWKRTA